MTTATTATAAVFHEAWTLTHAMVGPLVAVAVLGRLVDRRRRRTTT